MYLHLDSHVPWYSIASVHLRVYVHPRSSLVSVISVTLVLTTVMFGDVIQQSGP